MPPDRPRRVPSEKEAIQEREEEVSSQGKFHADKGEIPYKLHFQRGGTGRSEHGVSSSRGQ